MCKSGQSSRYICTQRAVFHIHTQGYNKALDAICRDRHYPTDFVMSVIAEFDLDVHVP